MAEIVLTPCQQGRIAAHRASMADRSHILRFGAFELHSANRQLLHQGAPVELGSRYFDALALLVARRGELVSKDEFMREIWHGIPVTDEALTQCIRTLRRALDDNAASPRFIQTVPKHGYRFIADAAEPCEVGPQTAPEIRSLVAQVAGTCTLAGFAAGAFAGLIYGIVAGTGGGGQVLILAAMVGALGLLAGAGLGAGIAAAMTWRGGGDTWAIVGAALGGLCAGSIGNLIGREGVGLLSGLAIEQVTGPFEGLIIGTATGLTAWALFAGRGGRSVLAIAVLAGAAAGGLIHMAGGTLLAGSLQALQQGLPGVQLNVDRMGSLIGEAGFTQNARAISAVIESQMFVLAIGAGLLGLRARYGSLGGRTSG